MNRDTMKNIKVVSRVLEIIFEISKVFCYVGFCVLAAGIVYVLVKGNLESIVLNDRITIHSPIDSEWLMSLDAAHVVGVCLFTALKLGLYLAIFIMASKLFKNVQNSETPFTMDNVKKIRIISILYFISSCFAFTGDQVGYDFELNGGGVIGALIIFGISYIFAYGCELQKESDETL